MPTKATSSAHTAGPWRIHPEITFGGKSSGHRILSSQNAVGADTFLSVIFYGTKEVPETVGEANARLIAAAPELLEACQNAFEFARALDEKHSDALRGLLSDAIAKAGGRA